MDNHSLECGYPSAKYLLLAASTRDFVHWYVEGSRMWRTKHSRLQPNSLTAGGNE